MGKQTQQFGDARGLCCSRIFRSNFFQYQAKICQKSLGTFRVVFRAFQRFAAHGLVIRIAHRCPLRAVLEDRHGNVQRQ